MQNLSLLTYVRLPFSKTGFQSLSLEETQSYLKKILNFLWGLLIFLFIFRMILVVVAQIWVAPVAAVQFAVLENIWLAFFCAFSLWLLAFCNFYVNQLWVPLQGALLRLTQGIRDVANGRWSVVPIERSTSFASEGLIELHDVMAVHSWNIGLVEALFSQVSDCLVVADSSGLVEHVGGSFTKVTGFEAAEAEGKTLGEFFAPPFGARGLDFFSWLKAVLAEAGGESVLSNVKVTPYFGSGFELACSIVVLRSAVQDVEKYFLVLRDQKELSEIRLALQKVKAEVAALQKLQEQSSGAQN